MKAVVNFSMLFLFIFALPVNAVEPKAKVAVKKVQAETIKPKKAVSVAQYIRNISVTVMVNNGSGSGTLVQTKDGQVWVWTAGHVIADLRKSREVGYVGEKKTKIDFDDAKILIFHNDKINGRIDSNYSLDAEVIRYSDADFGNDLALLRIRNKEFKPLSSAKFYLDAELPDVGTDLFHCGSLLGVFGSNSLTTGIISQYGRVLESKVYDQTTCTAFPGSSGGPVCLKSDGRYIGMLVRGAGETFNLVVPVRRMRSWAAKTGVEFAIDPSKLVPTNEVLMKHPIDDPDGTPDAKEKEKK